MGIFDKLKKKDENKEAAKKAYQEEYDKTYYDVETARKLAVEQAKRDLEKRFSEGGGKSKLMSVFENFGKNIAEEMGNAGRNFRADIGNGPMLGAGINGGDNPFGMGRQARNNGHGRRKSRRDDGDRVIIVRR